MSLVLNLLVVKVPFVLLTVIMSSPAKNSSCSGMSKLQTNILIDCLGKKFGDNSEIRPRVINQGG